MLGMCGSRVGPMISHPQDPSLNAVWEIFDLAWGDPDQNGDVANLDEDDDDNGGDGSGSSALSPPALAIENGDPTSESEVTTTQPEQTPEEENESQQELQNFFELNKLEESQEVPPGPNMELNEFGDESINAFPTPFTPVPSSGATGGSSMPAGPSSSNAALMPPPERLDPALVERKRLLMDKMAELRLGKSNNTTPRTITRLCHAITVFQ